MKKRFLIIFLSCIFNTGLYSQSVAAEIENLPAVKAVTYAQASRFILDAAGKMTTNNFNEAFQYAADRAWLPDRASANEAARLDDICLLLLKAFNIKGGIFYSLTGNSHYAYREVVYRNYLRERSDPAMNVSGSLLLLMVDRILSEYNGGFHDDVLVLDRGKEETSRNEALAAENALREDEIRRQEALAAQIAAAREAELAAAREAEVRRETELAAVRETKVRHQAELAAAREAEVRREAEFAAVKETEVRRQAELAAARETEVRHETELATAKETGVRRETELAVARETTDRPTAITTAAKLPFLQFLPNDIELLESEKQKLQEIAAILKAIPGVRLKIDGYAAFAGTRAGRMKISEGRARSVANYLILQGAVVAANITTEGHGAEFPIANNLTLRGMAANRRVVITILER
ncbi:MAG: OmpA family protein [Treponema sp.]|nr:OmpA family protein [Treponema sp.]MCL2272472.1 OmpA family protein [Treponema sp.]